MRLDIELTRPLKRHIDDRVDAARPGGQQHDAVGKEHRLGDRMRDENDRLAGLQPDALKLKIHGIAGHRVQRTEWLVHQQNLRIVGKRACDRGALAHAARQLLRPSRFKTADADEADELTSVRLALRFADTPQFERQRNVVLNSHPGKQMSVLEHHPEFAERIAMTAAVLP